MAGLRSRISFAVLVSCLLNVYCQSDDNQTNHCSDGVQFQDRCYWFSVEPMKWLDAHHRCSQYGVNVQLTVITNQEQQDWLRAMLPSCDMWIGLHDTHEDGHWQWVDNTYPNYTNWAMDRPQNSSGHNCALMLSGRGGVWIDRSCTAMHHYACSSSTKNPLCHSGGMFFRDRCYWMAEELTKSFDNAKKACQGIENGALPVILHDGELNAFLAKFVHSSMWLGLTDREQEGHFYWIDGSEVTYSNWLPGEPNNYDRMEDCGAMTNRAGGWNDVMCRARQDRQVVCSLPPCFDEGSGESGLCLDSSPHCSCVSGGYCLHGGRCHCLKRFHGMVCDKANVEVSLRTASHVMEGESIEFKCHVNIPKSDYSVQIQHMTSKPSLRSLPENRTTVFFDQEETGYHRVVISNATLEDTGKYVCAVSTSAGSVPVSKIDIANVKVKTVPGSVPDSKNYTIKGTDVTPRSNSASAGSGLDIAVIALATSCILLIIVLVVVKVRAKRQTQQGGYNVHMNGLSTKESSEVP